MALPQKIQVNAITGASAPSTIDGDLNTGIKQPLLDIFTIPNNTNITQEACEITASGMKRVRFYNAAGNPSNSGDLQRNAADLLFHDGTAARTTFLSGGAQILSTTNVGPHAIGGATVTYAQLQITGSYTASGGTSAIIRLVDGQLSPSAGVVAAILQTGGTINKAGSGTHPDFAGLYLDPPTIGAGAATLTNASTIKINGAPSGATNNYALWIAGGDVRWGAALVALGGGAAPTLGTIGGSGPATAAQNTWMRIIDSTGAAFWVPAWK